LPVSKHPLLSIRTLTQVLLVLGFDQISKVAARSFLSSDQPVRLLGGLLNFPLSRNSGSFLGLGSNLSSVMKFIVFSVGGWILIGLCLFFLVRRKYLSNKMLIALPLILGGALSNQIDRMLFHGLVTDFLFLSLGPVHTGIFNLADMAIMAGAGLMLMESWQHPGHEVAKC